MPMPAPAIQHRPAKPRKNKTKAKAKSATPGPAPVGPAFSIPETSEPLPPNFLRNQQALLGLAGMVGGINPAQLSTRSSRGTTVNNPIVVEEETPSISKSSWKARQPQLPPNAPLPSSQAIADSLVSQGNIFPVLRSLMPYFGVSANVGCCAGGSSTHRFYLHNQGETNVPSLTAPPLKKRKLHSVPAGAKDWDVPYPFPANEGPPRYLESWEKERGKKLMMQLIALVREAVQKAAAKAFVQEDRPNMEKATEQLFGSNPLRHYRSSVMNYGRDDVSLSAQENPNDPSPSTPSSGQEMQMSFPDFIASTDYGADSGSTFNSDFETLLGAVNDALSDPNVQLTGNDLAAMSSFGMSPAMSNSPTLTSSTRLSTPFDLTPPSTADNKENDAFSQFPDFNFNDIPIDPALMDFSWPNLATSGPSQSPPAGLFGGVPDESLFDATTQNAAFGQGVPSEYSSFDPGLWNIIAENPELFLSNSSTDNIAPNAPTSTSSAPSVSASNTRPCSLPLPIAKITSANRYFANNRHFPAVQGQPRLDSRPLDVRFMPPMVDAVRSAKPTAKKLDREDVVRRAKVRREQLAAEIARAKIELWETTIEQGILTHMSKDKALLPKE